MNVPAVQAFENCINLKKPKQGQDTDINIIHTDCKGSRADVSSYFCSGGHGGIFWVLSPPPLLNQHYRVRLSSKNSSLVGRKEETKHRSNFLCFSHLTSYLVHPKIIYLVS